MVNSWGKWLYCSELHPCCSASRLKQVLGFNWDSRVTKTRLAYADTNEEIRPHIPWCGVVSGLLAIPGPTLPCLKPSDANGLIRRNAAVSLGTICLHGHPCGFLNNCDVTGYIAVAPNPSPSVCVPVWFCGCGAIGRPHAGLCKYVFRVCREPQLQCPRFYNSAAVLHLHCLISKTVFTQGDHWKKYSLPSTPHTVYV